MEADVKLHIMPAINDQTGDRMQLRDKVGLLTGAAATIKHEFMGSGGAAAHQSPRAPS